jgi:hypothetical protein
VPAALVETASVLLLDRTSREHATAAFGPADVGAGQDAAPSPEPPDARSPDDRSPDTDRP